MISSNALTIKNWIRTAAPMADVVIVCSMKGQVISVEASSSFHTNELQPGSFILDLFKSSKELLTKNVEDLLNY